MLRPNVAREHASVRNASHRRPRARQLAISARATRLAADRQMEHGLRDLSATVQGHQELSPGEKNNG